MGENQSFSDRLFKEFRKSQHLKAQAVTFPKDSCCYARERQCSNKFKLQRTARCLPALPRTPRNLKISALRPRAALLCIKRTNVLWSQPYWSQTSSSWIGKQQQTTTPPTKSCLCLTRTLSKTPLTPDVHWPWLTWMPDTHTAHFSQFWNWEKRYSVCHSN